MLAKMEEIKKQVMKTPFYMNLQRFTDGDGGGTEGDTGNDGSGSKGSDGDANKPITFNTQAELDTHIATAVTKAVNDAKATWTTETQQKIDDAKTEAQKLANMTDEQKAAYQAKKREEDIAKREADITRRELKAQALEALADKELPKELISAVVLTDADACASSIDAIEKSFRKAVETAVNKRLAQSATIPGAGGTNTDSDAGSLGARLAKQATSGKGKKNPYFKN